MTTIQLRTRDNLNQLSITGESQAWIVANSKLSQILNVRVVNWDGTRCINAVFNLQRVWKRMHSPEDHTIRTVITFTKNTIIENCNIDFNNATQCVTYHSI